jgi:hypothetical protein
MLYDTYLGIAGNPLNCAACTGDSVSSQIPLRILLNYNERSRFRRTWGLDAQVASMSKRSRTDHQSKRCFQNESSKIAPSSFDQTVHGAAAGINILLTVPLFFHIFTLMLVHTVIGVVILQPV